MSALGLLAPIAIGSIVGGLFGNNKGAKAAETPATERASQMINLTQNAMASGINQAQMPAAMDYGKADYKQRLRNVANTQSMMAMTNPFLKTGNGAASGVMGVGASAAQSAMSEATNLARGDRFNRLSAVSNSVMGDASLAGSGLTDLGSIASNAAIRKLARDIEFANAQGGAISSLITGAGIGYMNRPNSQVATYNTQSPIQRPNYSASSGYMSNYLTRPFM